MNKTWEKNLLLGLDIWTGECVDDQDNFQKPEDEEETKTESMCWKVLTGGKGYKD